GLKPRRRQYTLNDDWLTILVMGIDGKLDAKADMGTRVWWKSLKKRTRDTWADESARSGLRTGVRTWEHLKKEFLKRYPVRDVAATTPVALYTLSITAGTTLREALDTMEAAAASVNEARADTDAFPLSDKEKQDALFVMLHDHFREVEEDVYCAKEDDSYRFSTYEAA
ncbi:unnamed protein product, partial [Phaeothamnion confervicola]